MRVSGRRRSLNIVLALRSRIVFHLSEQAGWGMNCNKYQRDRSGTAEDSSRLFSRHR